MSNDWFMSYILIQRTQYASVWHSAQLALVSSQHAQRKQEIPSLSKILLLPWNYAMWNEWYASGGSALRDSKGGQEGPYDWWHMQARKKQCFHKWNNLTRHDSKTENSRQNLSMLSWWQFDLIPNMYLFISTKFSLPSTSTPCDDFMDIRLWFDFSRPLCGEIVTTHDSLAAYTECRQHNHSGNGYTDKKTSTRWQLFHVRRDAKPNRRVTTLFVFIYIQPQHHGLPILTLAPIIWQFLTLSDAPGILSSNHLAYSHRGHWGPFTIGHYCCYPWLTLTHSLSHSHSLLGYISSL
jgi:hypothetical protein